MREPLSKLMICFCSLYLYVPLGRASRRGRMTDASSSGYVRLNTPPWRFGADCAILMVSNLRAVDFPGPAAPQKSLFRAGESWNIFCFGNGSYMIWRSSSFGFIDYLSSDGSSSFTLPGFRNCDDQSMRAILFPSVLMSVSVFSDHFSTICMKSLMA